MTVDQEGDLTHDILDTLVLGGDGTQCRRNDGLVESDEEDRHKQGEDDENELETRGIVWVVVGFILGL